MKTKTELANEILRGVKVNAKITGEDRKVKKWVNVLKVIRLPNKRKSVFKVAGSKPEEFKFLKQKDVEFVISETEIKFLIQETKNDN